MNRNLLKRKLGRLILSRTALAVPVTFLILFVSTLSLISFTYYFAVARVNDQGQILKVSTAKEGLFSIDNAVISTLGKPGSSNTLEIADSGGMLRIQPDATLLTLIITNGGTIQQTIFNSSVGKIIYELPPTSSAQIGFYLKGDENSIVSQSGSSATQLFIQNGDEHPEILLQYRPTVTYVVGGTENGMRINTVRIYLVNLNSSDSIALQGKVPLQIACTDTQLVAQNYQSAADNLTIISAVDGKMNSVSIPILDTAEGAVIKLEVVVSNISITRWIR